MVNFSNLIHKEFKFNEYLDNLYTSIKDGKNTKKINELSKDVFEKFDFLTKTAKQLSTYESDQEKVKTIKEEVKNIAESMLSLSQKINQLSPTSLNLSLLYKLKQKIRKSEKIIDSINHTISALRRAEKNTNNNQFLNKFFKENWIVKNVWKKIYFSKQVINADEMTELLSLKIDLMELNEKLQVLDLKEETLKEESLEQSNLKEQMLKKSQDLKDRIEFIDGLMARIKTSIEQKETLLIEIAQEYKEKSNSNLSETEKKKLLFHYFVQCRQILFNPFEVKVWLETSNTDLINFLSLLQQEKLNLQSDEIEKYKNIEKHNLALEAKQEGLKRILKYNQKNSTNDNESILISGAGPAGLMQALGFLLKNKKITILESFPEDKKLRENIVALGKSNESPFAREMDVKLLDFFGITNYLLSNQKARYDHFEDPSLRIFEAKIGDIQQAMTLQMEELTGKKKSKLIQYNSTIIGIEEGVGQELTTVTYINAKKEITTIKPSSLIILEGYHSTTRSLLGIPLVKLGEKGHMAFSFFSAIEKNRLDKKILYMFKMLYRLISQIGPLFSILRIGIRTILLNRTAISDPEEKALLDVLDRLILTLAIPGEEYLYQTLPEEQGKLLIRLKDDIVFAKEECKRLRQEITKREVNDKQETDKTKIKIQKEELKLFKSELKKFEGRILKWKKKIEKSTKQKAEHDRSLLNLGYSMVYGKGSSQLMKFSKTVLATTQVVKAETNYLQVGNLHVHLSGDASGTTDPVSGAGMRSGLEGTTQTNQFFYDPKLTNNPYMQVLFKKFTKIHRQGMQREGLRALISYRGGNKIRSEYFLERLEETGILDKEEQRQLMMLRIKSNLKNKCKTIEFTDEEKEQSKNLQSKLIKSLKQSFPSTLNAYLVKAEVDKEKDRSFFETTISQLIGSGEQKQLSSEEWTKLEEICAKLLLLSDGKDKENAQQIALKVYFLIQLQKLK